MKKNIILVFLFVFGSITTSLSTTINDLNPVVVFELGVTTSNNEEAMIKEYGPQIELFKKWVKEDLEKAGINVAAVVNINQKRIHGFDIVDLDAEIREVMHENNSECYFNIHISFVPNPGAAEKGKAARKDFKKVQVELFSYSGGSVVILPDKPITPKSGILENNRTKYHSHLDATYQSVSAGWLSNKEKVQNIYDQTPERTDYHTKQFVKNKSDESFPDNLSEEILYIEKPVRESEIAKIEKVMEGYPYEYKLLNLDQMWDEVKDGARYVLINRYFYKPPTYNYELTYIVVYDLQEHHLFYGAPLKKLIQTAKVSSGTSNLEAFVKRFNEK